jgi:dihydrodipicolinate synthase/N-acetylneuraminate lyase
MNIEERKEVAAFSIKYENGRVPVLVGTGSPSTREVIELSKHSQQLGTDGVVVINPYYWQLSEENLFGHYSDIAKAVGLPIILYNFPHLTGQDLSPELVLRLVDEHSHIVGIKETVDQAGHIREMILKVKRKHPHFSMLAGCIKETAHKTFGISRLVRNNPRVPTEKDLEELVKKAFN